VRLIIVFVTHYNADERGAVRVDQKR
jgi:hypothetical protein